MSLTKAVVMMGVGLLSGFTPSGRPCLYQGGLVRIAKEDYEKERDQLALNLFRRFVETALGGAEALDSRGDYEPADDCPLELSGCWDEETGDVLLMWRIPCVDIVKH